MRLLKTFRNLEWFVQQQKPERNMVLKKNLAKLIWEIAQQLRLLLQKEQ